eukprot:TRINITY_DN1693_c0_g1_i8.p1 TRINITY_DN1693_c0_g1~~TRINITY_DN1693_c0_g1_i8.p1  ORF type:complete len:751 (+),score=187.02 TRINITY_DN1693_c0_g1_i8:54-2306(+)
MSILLWAGVVAATAPWMDPRLPVEQRVNALLPKLNLEELSAQLVAIEGGSPASIIQKYRNTSFGSLSGETIDGHNEIQKAVINGSRWGIPGAFFHESLHGGCGGGTVFPMPLTLGSTFNNTLLEEVYSTIARDTRIGGANIAFSPVINLFTDPRYGRFQEGLSPDPSLTSLYTVSVVKGLQGSVVGVNSSSYIPQDKVASLAKHFVGYGGGAGGLNAARLEAGEREIRDVYLRPWRTFAEAGGKGAMPSHQTVLDVPMHANSYMTNTVFRNQLKWGNGWTISDCNDINVLMQFRVARNISEAAALGIKGGVDQDLQCGRDTYTYENIKAAVDSGLLTIDDVRENVRRVLTMKFSTGLFENPMSDPNATKSLDSPKDRALARQASREGSVLLKNGVLPLKNSDWSKTAVIGWLASSNASSSWEGAYTSGGVPVVTLMDALKNDNVKYSVGATPDSPANDKDIKDAVELVKSSEQTILVVGDSLKTCGEWIDRSNLDLPGGQLELLEAVAPVAKNLIVVVISGRPATFGMENAVLSNVSSLLWIGRPGEGGNALKEILLGAEPSGRLQASWPKYVGHVHSGAQPFQQPLVGKWVSNQRSKPELDGRVYDNYVSDPFGEARPLFYFGFGLSYSTFKMSSLSLSPFAASDKFLEPVLTVTFDIANTGSVGGSTVGQVYVIDPAGGVVVRPWKRLVGFKKVWLSAGQSTTVHVPITFFELAMSDVDMNYKIQSGTWTVRVGDSSVTDALTATFDV